MDLTVVIPTRNNQTTLEKLITSIKPLSTKVVFVDFGSTDQTIAICEKHGKVYRNPDATDRSDTLNHILPILDTEWIFFIQPWEVLTQGHDLIKRATKMAYNLPVISETILTKDVRLWRKVAAGQFVNPVYEYVGIESSDEMNAVIYSIGNRDYGYCLDLVEKWKDRNPTAPEPYYYQACTLLVQQKYEEFLKASEHYMFMDNRVSMSTVMNRYYYALVSLQRTLKVKPTLQNLNMCLCAKPLMAEFWCLLGDTYYHRLRKFDLAKDFYRNAILLGSRRLQSDKWPMDISKYQEYPERMIESCNKIIESKSLFVR